MFESCHTDQFMRLTEHYLNQLTQIHNDPTKDFGKRVKDCALRDELITKIQPASILDYGCGSGATTNFLKEQFPNIKIEGYDPAVSKYEQEPSSAEFVYCYDVMEHVEYEFVDTVLDHINSLSQSYVFFKIDLVPATKSLPDGRNCHLVLETAQWWRGKVLSRLAGNIVHDYADDRALFLLLKK